MDVHTNDSKESNDTRRTVFTSSKFYLFDTPAKSLATNYTAHTAKSKTAAITQTATKPFSPT